MLNMIADSWLKPLSKKWKMEYDKLNIMVIELNDVLQNIYNPNWKKGRKILLNSSTNVDDPFANEDDENNKLSFLTSIDNNELKYKNLKQQIMKEECSIQILQEQQQEEMKQLNQLKCEYELSCATFELEIAAYQLIHCLVLGRILPYEVVTLSYDAIDIRFRHLDVCKSYSILSWNNEECSSKNRINRDEFYNSNNISRDLINTHDSSLSSDSVLDIVNQIP